MNPTSRMPSANADRQPLPVIRAALIDISGTLHVGKGAIPGAIDACRRLISLQKIQQNNFKVLFLTNTSKISSTTLLSTLRSIGFDEDAIPSSDYIMTSVGATKRYLLEKKLRPYCLLEDDLLSTDFYNLGVDTIDETDDDDNENNNAFDEAGIGPNCVLVGLAPNKFNYDRLNTAYRFLNKLKRKDDKWRQEMDPADHQQTSQQSQTPPPRLIVIHRATHYRDSDHELSLGPGGFISLLEEASGVSAHVIGKPSVNFYNEALTYLGITDPAHAVMVGDDVVGDIGGALHAGLGCAILVKTGKYVPGDESGRKTDGVMPTLVMDSIVEAVDYICSQYS